MNASNGSAWDKLWSSPRVKMNRKGRQRHQQGDGFCCRAHLDFAQGNVVADHHFRAASCAHMAMHNCTVWHHCCLIWVLSELAGPDIVFFRASAALEELLLLPGKDLTMSFQFCVKYMLPTVSNFFVGILTVFANLIEKNICRRDQEPHRHKIYIFIFTSSTCFSSLKKW